MAIDTGNSFGAIRNSQQAFFQAAERISSGQRINSAADDAAGLAISNRLGSQISEFSQASRNASDGISLAQVGDGALQSVTENLQRIRELSLQAANGTLNDSDRSVINREAQQLREEITRITETTEFNGRSVLANDDSVSIQAGSSEESRVEIGGVNLLQVLEDSGLNELDLSSREGALSAIEVTDEVQQSVNEGSTNFGAAINRLDSTINNLGSAQENAAASRSRIQDADMAREVSELAQSQIQSQASIAMQAQANKQARFVLNLLS